MLWYALRIGMSYEAAMRQPIKRLELLTAIQQVKCEGMKFVDNREYKPEKMTVKDLFPDIK